MARQFRISRLSLSALMLEAVFAQMVGFKVVKPVYVDWFWRGYSIILKDDGEEAMNDRADRWRKGARP